MRHTGDPEELLASGARAGVTKFVVFSTATTPAQVEKINSYIMEQLQQHSEFIGAGTMNRDYENFSGELDRLIANGIHSVKLHPDFQKLAFDDEKMLELYSLMSDRGMFLITHAGDFRYSYSSPARIQRVAKLFPDLRIVAAHFGGWSEWDEGRVRLSDLPNIYVDISSTYMDGVKINETYEGLEEMKKGLRAFDPEHIFFGSDFPMWDHKEELDVLYSLGLDKAFLQKILSENFIKFYSKYGKIKP
jgi:predicted TIM-barrel fold metal-dependent hydrolase